MKPRPRYFRSKKKFFLRLFHKKCCLTCLHFDEKEKKCWARWAIENPERASLIPMYFEHPISSVWEIGDACKEWK